MILCDLPYGQTQNHWDSLIDLGFLWGQYWRILKENGAVALTCQQPFTSLLLMSQVNHFKVEWIWKKSRPSGHMNAKKQPLREHESVLMFYKKQCTYNPQFTTGKPNHVTEIPCVKSQSGNYGKQYEYTEKLTDRKYPKTIIDVPVVSPSHVKHPTQKPVPLMEYLIRTYTNPGEIVLDNCMGSGTTGVACANTGRDFIGCEMEEKYFTIAKKRIEDARDAALKGIGEK
jgi:site-specific DNA-methyltransferase (adenine-specific)